MHARRRAPTHGMKKQEVEAAVRESYVRFWHAVARKDVEAMDRVADEMLVLQTRHPRAICWPEELYELQVLRALAAAKFDLVLALTEQHAAGRRSEDPV